MRNERSETTEQIAARIAGSRWTFVNTHCGTVKVCSQSDAAESEWAVWGEVILRNLYWPKSHHVCLALNSEGSEKIQKMSAKACEDIQNTTSLSTYIRTANCPESFWDLIKTTKAFAESFEQRVLVVLCNCILADGGKQN